MSSISRFPLTTPRVLGGGQWSRSPSPATRDRVGSVADVRFRRLGESGLVVSVVGVGCNNFGGRIDATRADQVVHTALDLGVNLFDTADSYGTPVGRSE